MFKKIKETIRFQGNLKKKNYFEGWYYKFVTKDLKHSLALIPGISLNKMDSHAFIQVFISSNLNEENKLETRYCRFKLDDFYTNNNPFRLQIANNLFGLKTIKLDIKENGIDLLGELEMFDITPIEKTLIQPSIMGFFDYLAFLECYHGVVSMNHKISGKIKFNDIEIDFTEGKGYIEKDWGKSFPKEYVWMQSNNFADPKTSLMFSHAVVPLLGFSFKGLIANLHYNGKEYRFATYNGSKIISKKLSENKVNYRVKRKKYILEIAALSKKTIALASPVNGVMNNTIKEGLSGEIGVKLFYKNDLIYEDFGTNAGLEIMMKERTK
jgi:tocopherol cyclase